MPGTAVLTDGWHSFRALSGSYEHCRDAANIIERLPEPNFDPGLDSATAVGQVQAALLTVCWAC